MISEHITTISILVREYLNIRYHVSSKFMKIILDGRLIFFFFVPFFVFSSNIAPILPPLLEFTTQLRNIVVFELIRFSFTPGVRLVTMEHVWFQEFNSYNSNLNTLFRITDGLVYFEICRGRNNAKNNVAKNMFYLFCFFSKENIRLKN